jgi:tetratricopeptide (TPR) repeat protein
MPETGLNIAVAEFTSVTGDPLLKPDDGFNLQQALVAAMEAVRADLPAVLRTGEVRAVAAVSATDPALREAEVAQLAETLNATIVLYGSITPQENGVYRVDPQFYIPPDAAGFAGFDEVVGPTELGGPVQFKPPLNQPSLATLNAELNTRIEALKSIVEGLALLDAARTDEAYQRFETARNALESADYSSGLEVIQLMLGAVKLSQYRTASGLDLTIPADAAAAAPLLAQAETDFGRGLLFDPGYARLFLGLGAVALAQTNQQLFAAGVAPEAVQSRIVDARDWYSRALPVQTEQSPRGYVAIKARFGVAQTYLAEYQHAIQQYNQALKAQDNAGRETAATTAVAAREKAGENLQQVVSAYREAGQPGRLALLAGQAQALLGKLAFDEAFYWQATGQPEQAALLFAQVAVECNAAQAILEQPDLAKNLVALNLRARCFDWQAVANLNSATANPATARSVCDAAHRLGVLSGALAEESLLCLKLLENSSIPAGQE